VCLRVEAAGKIGPGWSSATNDRFGEVNDVAASMRRRAADVGALILVVFGVLSFAIAAAGLLFGTGGTVLLFALAIPLLAAGYGVLRRIRWARVAALIVAVGYGTTVAIVATTPLRGLRPGPGQSGPSLDPAPVLVAIAFAAAAVLILVGKADHRTADQTI
jgi:hypothetical protein